MAAPMSTAALVEPTKFQQEFCVMHVASSTKSHFIAFTQKSWQRFVHFADEWKKYSCREREVTLRTESELGLTLEPNADYPNNAVVSLGYHYDCYKRFCDQNKINRKKTTKANTPQIQDGKAQTTGGDDIPTGALKVNHPEAGGENNTPTRHGEEGVSTARIDETCYTAPSRGECSSTGTGRREAGGENNTPTRHSGEGVSTARIDETCYTAPSRGECSSTGTGRREAGGVYTDLNELDVGPISADYGKTPRRPKRGKITIPWSRRHMFPDECILCHSNKYKRDPFSGKRALMRLVKCELVSGGQLLEAAKEKHDVSLLCQIEGEDLVARELQYHPDCYKDYTRSLSKGQTPSTGGRKLYTDAYAQFSEQVIRKRLIEGKEILTLNKLNRLFINTIQEVSGIESAYRTWNLKKRLRTDFPQLLYVRPAQRNMSEIVFCKDLSLKDLVEDVAVNDSSTDESSTDERESDGGYHHVPRSFEETHTLYNAALLMKSILSHHQPASAPWPPQASHLSLDEARDKIPYQLYNFLAWLVGSSSEPISSDFVTVDREIHQKILSIAQDITYLALKGRTMMPKHIALATAVRHLTGSTQLIGVLNGLGHSVSHSTLLEHNTALAKLQITSGDTHLPPGILQHTFTTLVWDNIDFGEETLSGKGTTHSTNGIMIQMSQQNAQDCVTPTAPPMKRSRERTLSPPPTDLTNFMGHGKKKGPFCIGGGVDVTKNQLKETESEARKLDVAYNFARFHSTGIPSWTGFNTSLCSSIPAKSVVAYLPVLNASPTQMDTVQTILTRSLDYADALGEDAVVLVFDQAIYAKAQQIRWRDESLQKRLVVRLGMFHTKMTYLACIGKRFRDAGLADVMIESGIIAHGSLNGVMNGHHYNRSMRAHKVMHDGLRQLQWEAYIDSLSSEDERREAANLIGMVYDAFNQGDISEIIDSPDFIAVASSFDKFIATMCNTNTTFAFWTSYINMVEDVLLLTRATRTGNWKLHMSVVRRILPWMFAYDRPNYSRYLSAYYLEMCDLATTHPSVYQEMLNGNFAVQRQEELGFAKVECDLCIEQTCNRDAKTKGGLIGFTNNPGAVLRWLLTQHQCSAITNNCKAMAGRNQNASNRKELDRSRIRRDEADVEAVVSTIQSMINPFQIEGNNLIHLSSGIVASEDVQNDLMNAEQIGGDRFTAFCTERLQSDKQDFFSPIKRGKLATFGTTTTKTVSKIKGKTVTLKADRHLFARLMFIAKVRNVNLRQMMSYCLGPLPLPLSTEQGTLVKTNKATLMHHLEGEVDVTATVEKIPAGSVWLIDGMAMLQQLHSPSAPTTFYHLAEYLLQRLIKLAASQSSTEIHFVTDNYPPMSIKNAERKHRAASGVEVVRILTSSTNQKRPIQWKKFLNASQNKESFVEYLFHVWQNCHPTLYREVTVFIAHGKECHALKAADGVVQVTPILELNCDHEEADTRLLLHASYVSRGLCVDSETTLAEAPSIVIKSLDTDVFIIGLGIAHQIHSPLLFHTGRGDTVRTLHLNKIQSQLGLDVATSLMGLHPFTGCDSVSGFFGKGKIRAYKLLKANDEYKNVFSQVGTSFTLSDNLPSKSDHFVCHLYGQESAADVDEARYNMFRLGTYAEESLPPNQDALRYHIMRANYQAAIFRRCLQQYQLAPSPAGRGWKIVEDGDNHSALEVNWCNLPPAPEHILELTSCTCKKSKCKLRPGSGGTVPRKPSCCSELGMPCTELCACIRCDNRQDEVTSEPEDDGTVDSEED